MGSSEGDEVGAGRSAGSRAIRGCDTNGGMRIQDVFALVDSALCSVGTAVGADGLDGVARGVGLGDLLKSLLVADALGLEIFLCGVEKGLLDSESAVGLEGVEPCLYLLAGGLATRGDVAAAVDAVGEEPEEALEVAGDENVHCGGESLLYALCVCLYAVLLVTALCLAAVDSLLLVVTCSPEAVQDVVFVCGNDELVGGQAHALGKVASKNVAKVAGGDNKADLGGVTLG